MPLSADELLEHELLVAATGGDQEREACEGSLIEFLRAAWPHMGESGSAVINWHHELMAHDLEGLVREEAPAFRNVIFNVPPRTTKTLICNVAFPAWVWCQPPELWGPLFGPHVRFLCVSYGATLASDHATKMRRLVMGEWYRGHWGDRVKIRTDQASKDNFANEKGGERISASVEAGVLGRGGDCLTGDTLVETTRGVLRIDEIVEGQLVLSYDRRTEKKAAWRKVTAIARHQTGRLWRLHTERGHVIEATGEHLILTARGWVAAMDLAVGDVLTRFVPYEITTDSVSKIEFVDLCGQEMDVFDIQVADTECFFANSILVHNCQIWDDPQNPQQAESETERRVTIEALRNLATRVTDPRRARRILVAQRLHEEDATNYAVENWASPLWRMLPMRFDSTRADPADPREYDGQLLWPEVWTEELVVQEERELQDYNTAAQLQQSPVPRGGGIIQRAWWRLWPDDAEREGGTRFRYRCSYCGWEQEVLLLARDMECPQCPHLAERVITYPDTSFRLLSVDTAYGDRDENSYSAATLWGVWHDKDEAPRLMLMEAWRGRPRLRSGSTKRGELGLVEQIHAMATRRRADVVLIEKKTRGQDLYDEIATLMRDYPFSLEFFEPQGQGDKSMRLNSCVPLFTNDLVWAPDKAWAEMVISEVCTMPRAKYQDLSDTCSAAMIYLRRNGYLSLKHEHAKRAQDRLVFRGTGFRAEGDEMYGV